MATGCAAFSQQFLLGSRSKTQSDLRHFVHSRRWPWVATCHGARDSQRRRVGSRADGQCLDYDNVPGHCLSTWKEQAADRQTMIFTAGVAQAHHLAEYFRDQGVRAEAVDGTTPKEQRAHP